MSCAKPKLKRNRRAKAVREKERYNPRRAMIRVEWTPILRQPVKP